MLIRDDAKNFDVFGGINARVRCRDVEAFSLFNGLHGSDKSEESLIWVHFKAIREKPLLKLGNGVLTHILRLDRPMSVGVIRNLC